ncbi:MAG: hypothetical protein QXW83_04445 [Nitrososphaerales archaeon]
MRNNECPECIKSKLSLEDSFPLLYETYSSLQLCTVKLIDLVAYIPYKENRIVVKWSVDETCIPLVGCNPHRYRIELYDEYKNLRGTYYASEGMSSYYIAIQEGWKINELWYVRLVIEERVFIWFDCESKITQIKILGYGEKPLEPQKPPTKFEIPWTWLAAGGLIIAGIGVTAYLIRGARVEVVTVKEKKE